MAVPAFVVLAIAVELAADAIRDYLFPDNPSPDVNPTTPAPDGIFTPPFLGGQQTGRLYNVRVRAVLNGITYTSFNQGSLLITQVPGKINGIRNERVPNAQGIPTQRAWILHGNNLERVVPFQVAGSIGTYFIDSVAPWDGGADQGGNLPDGRIPTPIPNGGLPQNNTPVTTANDKLVEGGLPIITIPPILSTLAGLAAQIGAAIAAAQAAADALTAIKAAANAIDKVAKVIDTFKDVADRLRDKLNKDDKADDAKKRYFIRTYGNIKGDGYLDITPRPAPVGFNPLMLDFFCFGVPSGMGRFFGKNSYNWFRYKELGSICFLSPTSGVLSVHKIEHLRTSIAIPNLAIGFTYNLGLDNVINARCSMLYTQEKTS